MSPPVVDLRNITRAEIEQIQSVRLRLMLSEVTLTNPFYKAKLDSLGMRPTEIEVRQDLPWLPWTTKAELADDQQTHPLFGTNLTYPRSRYIRLHQTSGSTGKPLRWLDTPQSWAWILNCWTDLFRLAGVQPDDRFFFAFSFGPFLGFWAGFEGASRNGHFCLAGGGLSSLARLQFLLENEMTIVCCTPTYAMRLAEVAEEAGINLKQSPVRAVLVAGEPGGNIPVTRCKIESAWGARVIDHWGMTELGPLAIETPGAPGNLTVLETQCIAEVINPDTGEAVADGTEGELVVTTLGRWGSPVIRYRTGDRVRPQRAAGLLQLEGGILGRVDEMITIRGNNLYPSVLEEIIRAHAEVLEFRIDLLESRSMPHLRISVELAPACAAPDEVCERIATTIKDRWNFRAEVVTVSDLPRFELKAKRFFRQG